MSKINDPWKRAIYLTVTVILGPIAGTTILIALVLVFAGVLFALPMKTLTRVQEWCQDWSEE